MLTYLNIVENKFAVQYPFSSPYRDFFSDYGVTLEFHMDENKIGNNYVLKAKSVTS